MEAAVISALTAVIVVVLTNFISRLLEARRKQETTLEYVSALHAEIVAGLDTAEQQTSEKEANYSRQDTSPYAVADDTDFVFDSIGNDITLLPVDVIHEVVFYYKLSKRSILLTKALNDAEFRKQGPNEVRKFIDGILDLLKQQERAARLAINALEAYSQSCGRDLSSKRQTILNNRNDGTTHGFSPQVK